MMGGALAWARKDLRVSMPTLPMGGLSSRSMVQICLQLLATTKQRFSAPGLVRSWNCAYTANARRNLQDKAEDP